MRATDSLSIRGLVGLAKAEAKRWGSDHATVTHAASAFAQNWTGEFRDAFGSDGEALLHDVDYQRAQGLTVTHTIND